MNFRTSTAAAAMVATLGGAAYAQEPPAATSGSIFETRPSERVPSLPPFEPPEEALDLDLPQVPEPPPTEGLPYATRVFVKSFEISGNTVFTTAELKAIVAPFEGREITNNQLEEARQWLTVHYINNGYINSGAIIPDQRVADGIIQVQIIEGTLTRIEIEGTERFNSEFFSSRLELRSGPPLNLKRIEEELQILIQNSLVEGIKAELQPGDRPGEAVLKARVAETKPFKLAFITDNKLPPSRGEARVFAQMDVNNIAGQGDVLSAEVGVAEGVDVDVKARYLLPVASDDTRLGFYYEHIDAEVVEEPFDDLDIETKLDAFGVDIYRPFKRTPNEQFGLGLLFERRKSKSWLLGERFSFSPGVENGKSVVSVFRFVQDWAKRQRNEVFSARSTISLGVDAFGSTTNSSGEPDSKFVTWLAQFQWARRFGNWGHQLSLRFNMQRAGSSLLPIEKFTVGGLDSVRGYRTNQLVRDQGYTVSLQYQTPLFKERTGAKNLQFAAFLDNGGARNKSGPTPDPDNITGLGVGLIWDPDPRFHAEIYFAHGLDEGDLPSFGEHSLQDDSIYFRVITRPF